VRAAALALIKKPTLKLFVRQRQPSAQPPYVGTDDLRNRAKFEKRRVAFSSFQTTDVAAVNIGLKR